MNSKSNQNQKLIYPFNNCKTARIRVGEKEKLSKWCSKSGVFEFEEGYEVLHTMFFYRCSWLRCIVFPSTMRMVEQYSCVPYVETERQTKYHSPDDYEFPCDYRHRQSNWWWEVSKFKRRPLSVVIKNSETRLDVNAFGDGEEEIAFFLDFKAEFDVSRIKGKITVFEFGTWEYVNGIPAPCKILEG